MGRIFTVAALFGYVAVAALVLLLGTAVALHITWGELRTGPLVAFAGFALLLGMMLWRTNNPAILGLRGDARHQHRAMAYASLGMMDRSLASVDRHLQEHPDDAQSHCLRARVLMSKERWPEVLEALDRAVELDETPASLNLRGQVLSYIGLDTDAASDF